MDLTTIFWLTLFAVLAGLAALQWHRHRVERAAEEEARQRRAELRDRYYAEQAAAAAVRLREQQAKRAAERARDGRTEPGRDQLAEARRRREAEQQASSIPGTPMYDGSAHALAAGELPRSISGLSGSCDSSSSSWSASDSGSSDSGSCGGGD